MAPVLVPRCLLPMPRPTNSTPSTIGLVFLVFLACILGADIFFGAPSANARLYFFDVGEGDASLAVLPSGARILIDAGPGPSITGELDKIFASGDRSIDVAVISHPQKDHFGGFLDLVGRYRFGAFLINGRSDTNDSEAWQVLLDKIKAEQIPLIRVAGGDRVTQGSSTLAFLAPASSFLMSAELNDTALVAMLDTPPFKTLFTGDIGANVESMLLKAKEDLHADVLKVGHHGSKNSSSEAFLRAVSPRLAVISVGAKNTYGHPSPDVLTRIITDTAAKIFRTDENGTISLAAKGAALNVFAARGKPRADNRGIIQSQ